MEEDKGCVGGSFPGYVVTRHVWGWLVPVLRSPVPTTRATTQGPCWDCLWLCLKALETPSEIFGIFGCSSVAFVFLESLGCLTKCDVSMNVYVHVYVCAQLLRVSNSLRPHGPWPTRLLCPWDFPGTNTGVGCHVLVQGLFPIQG